MGWHAIDWAETWLVQPNGPRAGKPFRFTPWQMAFLLWWYALDDDGGWMFDHGARRLAKGSGKSPFAAVLALIELCAPVRLERFDDRRQGGVRARAVDMPWVQIAATAETQTANTMRMVRAFAPKGSKVALGHRLDVGKTKYYKQPEGTLEVITSSSAAAEGAESSFIVADETEHWVPERGGPDLVSVLSDNLAKSGNRMLETSNAWVPGVGSVAEATWDAWVAQEEGRLVDGGGRILYDARVAPPETDMSDPASLESALRYVYADCSWKERAGVIDVTPITRRIWSPQSIPSESRRKYLNLPTVAEDAWLEPGSWTCLADLDVVVAEDDPIALFFDGSLSRDATALVACRIADGHVFVPRVGGAPTIWEPDPKHTRDSIVHAAEVDAAVEQVFERFTNIRALWADVREWESYAKVEWPNRYGDRLDVWAVPSGREAGPVAWDMRSRTMEFTRAVELVGSEIVDRGFTHDGTAAMTRHVINARRRPNRWGTSIGKESPDSPKKIDAAVCVIGARMARRMVLASAPARSGIVYL